jgi:hypothetical protein
MKKLYMLLAIVFIMVITCCTPGNGPSAPPIDPSIEITSPTGSSGYSTKSSTVTLAGSSSDGVVSITWLNSRGGSGTAIGTTDWIISSIPLQTGDNFIRVTAKDSVGKGSSDSITVTYNPSIAFLSTLQMTPDSAFVNEATTVIFRIGIENAPNLDKSSVKVLRVDANNNIVGTLASLADDGNVVNGDDIASDGVFSGKAVINESTEGYIRLRVSADITETSGTVTAYTEVFNFSVMAHLTDAQFSKAVSMPNETQQKYDELKSLYGEALAKTKTVEWLKTQSMVSQAGISGSGNGIWYVLDSGTLGGILLNPEGTEGGRVGIAPKKPLVKQDVNYKSNTSINTGESATSGLLKVIKASSTSTTKSTIGNKNVLVIAPFNWQWKTLGTAFEETVYNTFKNASCPTFNVATPIYDSNANVEAFKTLSNYGIVVLHTHGDSFFNQDLKSIWTGLDDIFAKLDGEVVFLTGEKATDSGKATYESDLKKGRLAIVGGYYAITPAFITYYNKSFPDSIIYNGSCRGMYNHSMSSAFIGNGAKTYYGFSEYVESQYDNDIALTLFDSLVNNGKTTNEAFNDAITANGSNDGGSPPAYFKMQGSSDLTIRVEGIVNGSFETGNTKGWTGQGDVRIISQLGPLSPSDGSYMNIISTGLGSINDSDSSVEQSFCIPAGVTTLSFDYNVVSEEPMEFVGSKYDDQFKAVLSTTSVSTTIASESINTSSWTQVYGINFYGGDDTTFMTGWKHITYDVSSLAGQGAVTLKFHTWDKGDSLYDTAALLDNIKLE